MKIPVYLCFSTYNLYILEEGNLLVIASKHGKVGTPSNKLFDIPKLATELSRIGIFNQQDILLRKLGSKKILEPLFNSYTIAINSDYFPVLDVGAVRARYLRKNARELHRLRLVAAPLIETLENQPVRTTPLSINENHHLQIGEAARQAMVIYQYFEWMTKSQVQPSLPMDENTLAVVRNVRTIHYQQCIDKEDKWFAFEMKKGWLPYLHFLAKDTLPYLSPTEMEIIWADIEAASCFIRLPENIHHWFNLYKAVGKRDFEQVLQFAKLLLPNERVIQASEENNYLLMVSMLAHVALKRYDLALALLKRYSLRSNPPIEVRLLGAIAAQQRL